MLQIGINTFRTEIEKAGGKVIGFYSTAGQYDGVAILEAPDDETMMSVLLSLGSKGNVRTITQQNNSHILAVTLAKKVTFAVRFVSSTL